MVSLLFLSITIIAIGLLWHYMLKPAITGLHRDKLFDLRDETREWFIANGYSLDRKEYANIRNLLNSYIRVTESMRLSAYLSFGAGLARHPEAETHLRNQIKEMCSSKDKAIRDEIARVRMRASGILVAHLVYSSPCAWVITIVFSTVFFFENILKIVHSMSKRITVDNLDIACREIPRRAMGWVFFRKNKDSYDLIADMAMATA